MHNRNEFKQRIKLLIEDGYSCYFDLDDDQKQELTAFFVRQNLKARSDFLHESNDFDMIISSLMKFMITADTDERDRCIDAMRHSAVKHFENEISQIYDDEYGEYRCECNREHGLTKIYDKQTGEVIWIR